jgi:OOP family OmpA-OmpF porin
MTILRSPRVAIAFGLCILVLLAALGGRLSGATIAGHLSEQAVQAIAEAGGGDRVKALFESPGGEPSRHPILSGGEAMNDATRARIARAVRAIPGVGAVSWTDGSVLSESSAQVLHPLHCQEDVQALLRARTIRFEEGSARIDRASISLVNEVATALRPCLGSIIEITGHTDTSGSEPGNLALSRERAEAVRTALMERGIPSDGLRTRGVGSRMPVEGLEPADPANRRIEFSVLATEPILPTPVDTPGPR